MILMASLLQKMTNKLIAFPIASLLCQKQVMAARAEIQVQSGKQQQQIDVLKKKNELLLKEIQLIKDKMK